MDGTEEEFVPEEEAEVGPAALKKIREKLAKAVQEKQEYLEGWQRSRADFANYKREEAAMYGEKEARIKADLLESLLPALDSLDMALQHNPVPEVKLLAKQLWDSLRTIGVERFGKPGETFDPHRHEALKEVEAPDGEADNTIEAVLASGYSAGERVIRPAKVSVFVHRNS